MQSSTKGYSIGKGLPMGQYNKDLEVLDSDPVDEV